MDTTFEKFFVSDLLRDIPLEEVMVEASDSVMITNGDGVICGIGHTMLENLGATPQEILGYTVDDLVAQGYYDRSVIRECINKRKTVSGLLKDRFDHNLFSTAKPIFSENGHIRFVVTNTRGGHVLDQYLKELQESRNKYQGITDYLRTRTKKCGIVAQSSEMVHLMSLCKRIAATDGTVLLTGESGTGKEVCATYIYENSRRVQETFLPINCSAIPADLVESELFGYEKGAFTGADTKGRTGLLEVANHGTVFLDEVGELPLHVQPKLLRFLETGEIKRVGGSKYISSDVRIIAATNRDLKKLVAQHKFREDLYYRLNVVPLHIAPLRDRREDILPLAEFFLSRFNRKYEKQVTFPQKVQDWMMSYAWPGNVRELRNFVERTVITGVEEDPVPLPELGQADERPEQSDEIQELLPLHQAVKEFETAYIQKAVRASNGNMTQAAKLLCVHRSQLYRKLSEHQAE
ncbi:sigma 54-interacting transcriptional regulator [uncultured Intestinimonas sp.]|uniref:sigma-54 interaction domain-containing protein n=1 Tax=uncultured Intestinimonas sp. TaxID=1689265 RepID=UPI0026003B54|nr:sigma 54-interacting transcriptional regulator [uncultured Intestinimonas sp.]